jgi:hypothetical protein
MHGGGAGAGAGGDAAPESSAVEPGVHDLPLKLRRRLLLDLRRRRGGRDHRLAAPRRRPRLLAAAAAPPHPPQDARGELDGDEQQDVEQRQRAAAAHRRAVRRRLARPLLFAAAGAHAALFFGGYRKHSEESAGEVQSSAIVSWLVERERGGNGVRACVALPFLPALLRARKWRKAEGRKKSIPNFLLLAPHDRCTVTAKSQNQAFFSAETRRVFFLTTARSGERSQAGDAIATAAVAVACPPRTSGDRPPSLMGSRGRARPRGRFALDLGGYTAKDSRFPA